MTIYHNIAENKKLKSYGRFQFQKKTNSSSQQLNGKNLIGDRLVQSFMERTGPG